RVQPAPHPEPVFLEGLLHRQGPVPAAALELLLGQGPLVVALRIEPCQRLRLPAAAGPRCRCLPPGAGVADAVDAPPAALGLLAVGPVGDEEGAVALDDEVGGLEGVAVFRVAGGELGLL